MSTLLLLSLLACEDDTATTALQAQLDAQAELITTLQAQAAEQDTTLRDLRTRLTEAEAVLGSHEDDLARLDADGVVLESRVEAAETSLVAVEGEADALWAEADALHGELDAASPVVAEASILLAYVDVDEEEDTVTFTGANVFVVSGSGLSGGINGLGNLLVGYPTHTVLTGSHNLIVGPDHEVTSSDSVVFGSYNTSSDHYTSILGGSGNSATETGAVVVGGRDNTASGAQSVVLGGDANTASGLRSTVYGGSEQDASEALSYAP